MKPSAMPLEIEKGEAGMASAGDDGRGAYSVDVVPVDLDQPARHQARRPTKRAGARRINGDAAPPKGRQEQRGQEQHGDGDADPARCARPAFTPARASLDI